MSFFQSRRSAVIARNGAVATSQPLATQAGLRVLQDGGNAVDAAVASAAVLAVVEPGSTGVGGDMFALTWMSDERTVSALNGSGRSAAAANEADVRKAGFSALPFDGDGCAFSVSTPGTVDGWQTLLDRYGSMPLSSVLAPAIDYALNGYGVSDIIAHGWQEAEAKLARLPSGMEMLPGGRAPRCGEVVRLESLGRTLQSIAEGGRDAFYTGDIAARIADFVQQQGGWLTSEDLHAHRSDWDEPIATDYRGVTLWECPPNGQGIAALMALNIAEGFDVAAMGAQSAERYHHLIESMRCAFADALRHVADPRATRVPVTRMLSKEYAAARRREISADRANPGVGYGTLPPASDTVYVTAVDGKGNACSLINSLFKNFGSGLVVPGTGVTLQNRGALFSFDPDHPNYLQGGKRPYQTIIPAMATRGEDLWLSFGVMGGYQQPQGHLQVLSNMVDHHMDPQAALDALRFRIMVPDAQQVAVEEDLPQPVIDQLRRWGHDIQVVNGYGRSGFGGGQVIARNADSGVLVAGSEPRKDGAAMGW